MGKPIEKIEFWDERIKDAKMRDQIHRSVYITTGDDWSKIEKAHSDIIKSVIGQDDKVLDAGCAYGRFSKLFNKKNYTGVDFVPGFILEATKLCPGYVFFIQDLRKLTFKDKEFDWVILGAVRQMIVANLGQEVWNEMETELKRVGKKILVLEYIDEVKYEIL